MKPLGQLITNEPRLLHTLKFALISPFACLTFVEMVGTVQPKISFMM